MELNTILSDLTDDLTDINNKNITTENIQIENVKRNGFDLTINKLPKETIDKMNSMFNMLILKQNIDTIEKVDYALATEVFTMIPDDEAILNKAKLTSNPSIINKELVNKIFNTKLDNNLRHNWDILEKINELKDNIDKNIDKIDLITNNITSFLELSQTKNDELNNIECLLLFEKNNENGEADYISINVYKEKIKYLIELLDTEYDLKDEFKINLRDKLINLYTNNTLNNLISNLFTNYVISEISLSDIYFVTKTLIDTISNKKNILLNYNFELEKFNFNEMEINNKTMDIINGSNDIIETLTYLETLYDIITVEENYLIKYMDVVSIL